MATLIGSPARVWTCWENGLADLADHYESLGFELYGTWIRALKTAATAGCKNRRVFRTVVADILDTDKNSGGMSQMANCAYFGRLYDVLSGAMTYDQAMKGAAS
jgi:hypothetical protein